jgi:hypothetical protein
MDNYTRINDQVVVYNSSVLESLTLASLPSSTWTNFGDATAFACFRVLSSANQDVTDNFDYRQSGGKWQVFSLTNETNLKFIVAI